MKNYLLFFSIFFIFNIGQAQIKYSFDNYGWNNLLYHSNTNKPNYSNIDSFALSQNIYQIKRSRTYISKKGQMSYTTELTNFDDKGRSNQRTTRADTGKKQHIYLFANRNYNANGLLQSSYYKSQYTGRTEFYTYNDSNKIIQSTYYNQKAKFSGQTLIDYNNLGKEKRVIYFNHKNHISRSYDYVYTSNGQLKQTVLKNSKGKVKLVTDYNCDNVGKAVQKLKDTAKICATKSYLPNGNIITTTHGFNYNGKPYKTVEISDSMNQLLKYEFYNGLKETLLYATSYTYASGKLIKTEVLNMYNPKKPYTRITEKDLNGRITKDESTYQISKSKQTIYKNTFVYDAQGMITKEQSFKNGKLYAETLYSYIFYK